MRKNSDWFIFLLPHQQEEFKKNLGGRFVSYMEKSGYTFGGFIFAAFELTKTEEGYDYWYEISLLDYN